jgi:pimeloyl-ACP methyl ester carboxylesterase
VDYIRLLLSFNYSKAWVAAHSDEFAAIVSSSLQFTRTAAGIRAQAMGIGMFDITDRIANIAIPVLVIHGDADALIPIQCGESIAAKITAR